MGLTGVIYAAIVVAWAVYLVPLALRRHDQTARNRSIERFSSSMRVLSTGGRGATSSPMVGTPARQEDNDPGPSTQPVAMNGASAVARPPSRAASKAAAARRRRVLSILVAVLLITGAMSVVGVIPAWSVAIPGLLIAAFLVIARRQVRIANRSYAERAGNAHSVNSNDVRPTAARVVASHGTAHEPKAGSVAADASETASPTADEQDPADKEPTITLSAAEVAAARAEDQPEGPIVDVRPVTADSGSLWDPLPITLPAYVDKPVAKRSVRKIAIGEAGTWSAGHAAAAASTGVSKKAHQADAAAPGADDQTDAAGERPRAANA